MTERTCSGEGCESTEILARDMCTKHYQRWWKHGDPETTKNRWGQDRDGGTKQCAACKEILPVEAFYKRKDNGPTTGRPVSRCKDCYREHGRAMSRQRLLASVYSLTLEQYNLLVITQKGVCAICGNAPGWRERGNHLSVDHDHESGAVRGLLCARCNAGIGMFRDSPELLAAAIAYLKRAASPAQGTAYARKTRCRKPRQEPAVTTLW